MKKFYAWHPPILDRAAEHGCLDEDVQTGDPIVCKDCCSPSSATPTPTAAERVVERLDSYSQEKHNQLLAEARQRLERRREKPKNAPGVVAVDV